MADDTMVLFNEIQRFRQVWIWAILTVSLTVSVLVCMYLIFKGPPAIKEKRMFVSVILGMDLLIFIVIMIVVYSMNLRVQVRSTGLYVRFYPFQKSFVHYPVDDLKQWYCKTQNAVSDYGGWGIRHGRKGNAYTVSGDSGVLIEFRDGRKNIFIGSQVPHELLSALDTVNQRGKTNVRHESKDGKE
jgi:hypothetical protein